MGSPRVLPRYVPAVIAVVVLSAVAAWMLPRSSSTDSAVSPAPRGGRVHTGSVRTGHNRVRVGVQLLAARSGETIWSEQYDGDVRNVLDVQSTVALSVARALQASLAPQERARIERPPTESADAYALYLKSRPFGRFNLEQNAQALALLHKAVSLDPKFAVAHAAIAIRYYSAGT